MKDDFKFYSSLQFTRICARWGRRSFWKVGGWAAGLGCWEVWVRLGVGKVGTVPGSRLRQSMDGRGQSRIWAGIWGRVGSVLSGENWSLPVGWNTNSGIEGFAVIFRVVRIEIGLKAGTVPGSRLRQLLVKWGQSRIWGCLARRIFEN